MREIEIWRKLDADAPDDIGCRSGQPGLRREDRIGLQPEGLAQQRFDIARGEPRFRAQTEIGPRPPSAKS